MPRNNNNNKETKVAKYQVRPLSSPPPPTTKQPSILGEMMNNVISGFSFGIGSSLAKKTVDSIMTPSDNVSSEVGGASGSASTIRNDFKKTDTIDNDSLHRRYFDCLREHDNNHEFCHQFEMNKYSH
jgi:hypothetical protein